MRPGWNGCAAKVEQFHSPAKFNAVYADAEIPWAAQHCRHGLLRGVPARWPRPPGAVQPAFFSIAQTDLSHHESEPAMPNPIDGACVPPRRGERPRNRIPTEPQQQTTFQSRVFQAGGRGKNRNGAAPAGSASALQNSAPRGHGNPALRAMLIELPDVVPDYSALNPASRHPYGASLQARIHPVSDGENAAVFTNPGAQIGAF